MLLCKEIEQLIETKTSNLIKDANNKIHRLEVEDTLLKKNRIKQNVEQQRCLQTFGVNGIGETISENTDEFVLQITDKMNVNIWLSDIDWSLHNGGDHMQIHKLEEDFIGSRQKLKEVE